MINRILERLEEELDESGVIDDDDYFLGKYTAYNDAISIVKEESQNGGWIPVSERLPEEHQAVIVYMRGEGIAETGDSITFMPYSSNVLSWWENVIAWMPLPEPYKGE